MKNMTIIKNENNVNFIYDNDVTYIQVQFSGFVKLGEIERYKSDCIFIYIYEIVDGKLIRSDNIHNLTVIIAEGDYWHEDDCNYIMDEIEKQNPEYFI